MTQTPTQIATQAAEAYYKQMHEYCGAYRQDAPDLAALILSAAAKIVRESGAVEALEQAHDAAPGFIDPTVAVSIRTALAKLRAIGEAQQGDS